LSKLRAKKVEKLCNSSQNKWRLTGNFENGIPESDSETGNDYLML
jgi:hypothetical protein